jgi:D-glycero-D-manno-heptose 1,7-bisphosphate phosphatase
VKRALFLDRDGTIIEDRGYMRDPNDVVLLPGAAEALRAIEAAGWILIVVSNQSGVGRGLIAQAEMDAVQARFLDLMRAAEVSITASYLCAHHPGEDCGCRKPGVLHLQQAAREHGIDLRESWMVGDRESDILCGKNAGCRTIWLRNSEFPPDAGVADYEADGLTSIPAILSRNVTIPE